MELTENNCVEITDEICVIGLGFVGLTLAVSLAEAGFTVVGIENNKNIFSSLQNGVPHFREPGLRESLKKCLEEKKLEIYDSFINAKPVSTYIITVGTPLLDNGGVNLENITSVCKNISIRLREDDTVILRSTVKLGVTENTVNKILRKSGVKFNLAFCPERTLEGNALKELKELPQIIGGITQRSVEKATRIFQKLTPVVLKVSDVTTAEMIKLVDNSQRDLQFAYANEVALACDAAGVSAKEVVTAGKFAYSRTNLPMPGLVGGPCLEKDPHIFAEGLKELGLALNLTKSARNLNESLPNILVEKIVNYFDHIGKPIDISQVLLLGLAFKGEPATDDLRGTMAIPIIKELKRYKFGRNIVGFDMEITSEKIESLGILSCANLESAFEKKDLVLILNNHSKIRKLPLGDLSKKMNSQGLIYDVWNLFDASQVKLSNGVKYVSFGSHKFLEGI